MKKDYGKSKIILFITLFLVMVGFGIIIPIIPFYVNSMGGGSAALGIFMSAYSVMQFFFAPFWGRLSDKIGRRPVLLIGLSGYGATFILFGLAKHLWILILVRALSGMVSSATLPTAMAYLADITEGDERSKNMGMVGASMGLGMVFGPAIGGWLGHYSFSLPFFVSGILAFLIFPFAWKFLPETLKETNSHKKAEREKLSLNVIKNPLFILFVFAFIMNFAMAIFESTFALLVANKIGFGPQQMGTIFALLGIVGVIVQGGLIGRLVKRFGDARLMKTGAWMCGIGFLMIILSNNKLFMFLATSVFMAGNSLMGPTSNSLATKNAAKGQGVSLGFMQSFGSLGRILGPITGGVLYGFSMNLPYIVGASLLIIIVLIGSKKVTSYERIAVN
ncbi:MFS transporter [Clostridium aciditolerans]|uniref:MFS transporter n=1 Tax=Clostridium aciditolerans TaxID=339861 RepID=A0A934M4Z1_9CLOT|nr:MFS transporter [Clostridium aciditolerans]MBI6874752.1 MFS transporter [Clostridium aciditolerans]